MRTAGIGVAATFIFIFALTACAPSPVKPDKCPAGTQALPDCPPEAAINDLSIARIYEERRYRRDAESGAGQAGFGVEVEIPVTDARARVIGSRDEDGLMSLATKIHLIEQADHTIDLVYYIFRHDVAGLAILGALCNAVERGVDIRIMVDSLGSLTLDKTWLRALESCSLDGGFMRNADGEITIYKARVQPVIFNAISNVFVKFNRRSHDKLLVVDGEFQDKAAVMTGGRNVGLDYYAIQEDGSPNPDNYRDAEILLRGGQTADGQSVGAISEHYYTLLFLLGNNERVDMTALRNPETAYRRYRTEMREGLAKVKSFARMQEPFQRAPQFVSEGFHTANVQLAHAIQNISAKHVVSHEAENAHLNPNSIMNALRRHLKNPFESIQIVSPYLFAALYKDDSGAIYLDEADLLVQWLRDNPHSSIEIVTNSVLTSDNFSTQAVIDMDLAPRMLFDVELQETWLDMDHEEENDHALFGSVAWNNAVENPRLSIFETGRKDDSILGGDVEYSKLHAKYIIADVTGFIGTTNFDYRSRLFNNEMGFFFESPGIVQDLRKNTEYLKSLSYRWGSSDWLEMRQAMMQQSGTKASTTRHQRALYKSLKGSGLDWFF